ncbi:MAG: hypothetical protein M3O35_19525 [Acidobacteriota bacterium]|nr:hypothetical protein [Acidobacteriota bacterium]
MAVYKRTYRGYAGPLTPSWPRFLVLAQYAWRGLFRSRFITALFVISFFYPLGAALALYANHNTTILSLLRVHSGQLFEINERFFITLLMVQANFAYLLISFAGPGLIASDVSNGAIPLYLCRPFSRTEYVLGKMAVLFKLLSWVMWVPGLVLFGVQSTLSGSAWMFANLRYAMAIFVSSIIWIVVLSLMVLALSAWVKWRIAAGALLLASFSIPAGFGAAMDAILHTHVGLAFNLLGDFYAVWFGLFGVDPPGQLSTPTGWIMLSLISAACLWLLSRKIRAREVVR